MRVRPLVGILILLGGIIGLLVWMEFRQGGMRSAERTNPDLFEQARVQMVEGTIESRGIKNLAVLRAMRSVPRHEFIPEEYLDQAYDDHPLPIGYGQTISQPYVVAWMTELNEKPPAPHLARGFSRPPKSILPINPPNKT